MSDDDHGAAPTGKPRLAAWEQRLLQCIRERRARGGRHPCTFVMRFDGMTWQVLEAAAACEKIEERTETLDNSSCPAES